MADELTRLKWDRASASFDIMASRGPEARWAGAKQKLFSHMSGRILFLALGTGLDIERFPPGQSITAIDISPGMLEKAAPRIAAYSGSIEAKVMDVHEMTFDDASFDQVFTSCTFCSVPDPIGGLKALRRVLRPGGDLFMFEHTGSRYLPFAPMLKAMTLLTGRFGPAMDRPTVENVAAAGFTLLKVENLFLDVVRTIRARA